MHGCEERTGNKYQTSNLDALKVNRVELTPVDNRVIQTALK